MFTQDQLIVYPAQGVGKIERIEHQHINGNDIAFYVIQILNNNITVMVPVANAANIGLRTLYQKKEALEVLDTLQDRNLKSGYSGQNWNRRCREYSERLKSSSLFDVASIVRELFLISGEKELSFGERRLLEQALGLISTELSIVFEKDMDAVKTEIESFFADIVPKTEKNQ